MHISGGHWKINTGSEQKISISTLAIFFRTKLIWIWRNDKTSENSISGMEMTARRLTPHQIWNKEWSDICSFDRSYRMDFSFSVLFLKDPAVKWGRHRNDRTTWDRQKERHDGQNLGIHHVYLAHFGSLSSEWQVPIIQDYSEPYRSSQTHGNSKWIRFMSVHVVPNVVHVGQCRS